MNDYNRAIRQAVKLLRSEAARIVVNEGEVGYQQYAPNPSAQGRKAGISRAADLIEALEVDE